ncbi:MAG TPA: hypothetical protein VD970_02190 [Acetobacteraceae bacterium]|nr:hypothetical protein [Acetobacteraceae bacterium]
MNIAARIALAVAAAGILIGGGWFGGWVHAHEAAVGDWVRAGADVNRRDCGFDVHEDRCVSRRSALDVAETAEIKATLRAAGARR